MLRARQPEQLRWADGQQSFLKSIRERRAAPLMMF
jgi:hypothetical protein